VLTTGGGHTGGAGQTGGAGHTGGVILAPESVLG